MLDHMEVIGHDTRMRQRQLYRLAERDAHVHAHCLHRIAVTQSLEQVADLVFCTSSTDLKYLTRIEVAQDGVIVVAFASSKLINAQIARRR